VAKPGEKLDEMQRAVGSYVTSECTIFALSVKDPNDLPADIRDDIMRFRDAYRTPDAPIETRHLDLYSGYVHEFKQEHAPLVNEKILKETTLTGPPEELLCSGSSDAPGGCEADCGARRYPHRSAEGDRRFCEVCDRQRLNRIQPGRQAEGGLEDTAFQHPPFKRQDIDLAAANLGFKLANAKDIFPPMSDGAAEMLLTETEHLVYKFHWELK
jgi:hypothetical protein